MNIEMPCHIEIVVTDGLVYIEECEMHGPPADKLRELVEKKGKEGNGWRSLEIETTASIYATPDDPGRLTGPPENCYPPEGGDWVVEELKHGETGLDLAEILCPETLAGIEEQLRDQHNKDEDDARGEWLYEQRRERDE